MIQWLKPTVVRRGFRRSSAAIARDYQHFHLLPAAASSRRITRRREHSRNMTTLGGGGDEYPVVPHKPIERISKPHPGWQPGDSQPSPLEELGYSSIEPEAISQAEVYHLMISAVVPRPIALVSSISAQGRRNLAPFSYFNVICHHPPTVMVSLSRKRGGHKKDTQVNAEETGEFVINIMNDWFIEAANHTSGEFLPGVDEAEISGLTRVPSTKVRPERIKESAFQMECRLTEVIDIKDDDGNITSSMLLGRVVLFHISNGVYKDGKVTMENYQPVARLGGAFYGRVSEYFEIPRPQVTPETPGNVVPK